MSRIEICYTDCCIETQTVAPTLPGFQCIKCYIKYLSSKPHKPIFYPYNFYDGSNFIILTWSRNQVEDYITHNFLECHQYVEHPRILNRRRSVSDTIHNLLGVYVYWKVKIKPYIACDSNDVEI